MSGFGSGIWRSGDGIEEAGELLRGFVGEALEFGGDAALDVEFEVGGAGAIGLERRGESARHTHGY